MSIPWIIDKILEEQKECLHDTERMRFWSGEWFCSYCGKIFNNNEEECSHRNSGVVAPAKGSPIDGPFWLCQDCGKIDVQEPVCNHPEPWHGAVCYRCDRCGKAVPTGLPDCTCNSRCPVHGLVPASCNHNMTRVFIKNGIVTSSCERCGFQRQNAIWREAAEKEASDGNR